MRPFEILLSLANLSALCLFAIPRLRTIHWMGYSALITAIIAGSQMLIEGPRWQMVPAYVFAGLCSFVWLFQHLPPVGDRVRHVLTNRLTVGLSVGLGVLLLAVSTALPIVFPVFRFPRPTGPYQIGTATYHWVDSRRHEVFSADPQADRELMAQVWYPVKGDQSAARAPYVQDARALSSPVARAAHLPGFFFDYFEYVATHAIPSAPMATDTPTYPVLIFLTGITGFRQSNTFQVEELVSHGYIVVGIDQPYVAASVVFPDGRQITGFTRDQVQPLIQQSLNPVAPAPMLNGQAPPNGIIPYLAQDVSFTLDQLAALNQADPNGLLTGRLDLQRVGTFGVSLGAMVASEACHLDTRLRACLMMDAAMPADVVEAGLREPSMWLTRDAETMQREGWSEADITQTLTTMRAVFAEAPAGSGYYVQVPGMYHVNFTDAPYFTPLAAQLGFAGPIDAQRAFDIVNVYSLAFFDQQLAGRPAALLEGPSKEFPEVLFGTR